MIYQLTTIFRRFELWIVIALMLLGMLLRSYKLEELMIFTYDQGRDMYALQAISRGDIRLIGPTTGLPGFFLGPFFYYVLLPGFIISNGSPFGVVRWLMLLVTLVLPLAYYFLKPIVGRRWALVGYLLLLLAPAGYEESRVMWNPSLAFATVLVSLYCLQRSTQNKWWLLGSALGMGLSLQTELAYAIFLIPVFVGWVLYHLAWPLKTKQPLYDLKVLLAAVVMVGGTLIPQAVFELKNNFLLTNSVVRESSDPSKQVALARVWENRPYLMAEEIVRSISGDIKNVRYLFLPILFAALWLAITPRRTKYDVLIFWLFALPLFGFMMHKGNYGNFFNYYLSPHYGATLLMLTLALAKISKITRWQWLPTVVLIAYIVIFVKYAKVILDVSLFKYTAATQIQALHKARQLAQTNDYALEVFVPNLIPVSYQYLSEWLSRTGQAVPVPYGVTDQKEYIILYEPYIGDGSKVAFKDWYLKHAGIHMQHSEENTYAATCTDKQTIGITTIERCVRN